MPARRPWFPRGIGGSCLGLHNRIGRQNQGSATMQLERTRSIRSGWRGCREYGNSEFRWLGPREWRRMEWVELRFRGLAPTLRPRTPGSLPSRLPKTGSSSPPAGTPAFSWRTGARAEAAHVRSLPRSLSAAAQRADVASGRQPPGPRGVPGAGECGCRSGDARPRAPVAGRRVTEESSRFGARLRWAGTQHRPADRSRRPPRLGEGWRQRGQEGRGRAVNLR